MGDFLPILTFPKGRNRYYRSSGCLIISNLSITKVTCIHKALTEPE